MDYSLYWYSINTMPITVGSELASCSANIEHLENQLEEWTSEQTEAETALGEWQTTTQDHLTRLQEASERQREELEQELDQLRTTSVTQDMSGRELTEKVDQQNQELGKHSQELVRQSQEIHTKCRTLTTSCTRLEHQLDAVKTNAVTQWENARNERELHKQGMWSVFYSTLF